MKAKKERKDVRNQEEGRQETRNDSSKGGRREGTGEKKEVKKD